MLVAVLVLGVLALVAAAGAVMLLVQRGALAARAASAEQAAATHEGEASRLRAQAGELAGQVQALSTKAADLTARLELLARSHDQAMEALTQQHERDLESEHRRHEQELQSERERSRLQVESAQREAATKLEAAQKQREQIERVIVDAETKFRETFGALAGEQLSASTKQFLQLAEQRLSTALQAGEGQIKERQAAVERLVQPIADTLKKTDEKLAAIETARVSAYSEIKTQVEQMSKHGAALQVETGRLVQALREPRVRGHYGEIQLKRVAELAGMREYCDFVEQDQTVDAEGKRLRPDMVVRLPNNREIVVDAKANIQPYMEALSAPTPEAAEGHLQRFADGVANQAVALGKKGYWPSYDGSAEFVVMFVPGDQFVDAALARRPDLLETAASAGVILASPSTLIAMLRAVAVSFREEKLTRNARDLLALGKELHERAATALAHVDKLGGALKKAVEHYNLFIGSYESRIEPTLNRFEEVGCQGAKALPEVTTVNLTTRKLRAAPGLEEA